ncbi:MULTISPECIES: M3 family metallopeptidase [unclassified Flavobacterium]|uniref:M3 family metallopeptidase n=1 Tax=unclassified Flavobacterium TaxID=196869 RepID=UPI000F836E13|nr:MULTISPECIES: M3 family metallopeptidase [unclassified Flavobacterium]RTY76624.1 M3 family peptidase [Flavobacterium sp. LS1R10]RTY88023.1 M3 family peptidase [Flavobacterium sp. RSP15]
MRKKSFFILLVIGNMLTIEAQEKQENTSMNPFFQAYDTPFNVPPFDKIKNEHFKPAILEGISTHQAEVNAVANNTQPATFENTILAMENAGELLSNVNTVFSNLNSANTNKEIQNIAKEMAPNLSAHRDNIYLNEKLFAKVKTLWDKKETLGLNLEQAKILDNAYKDFVRSGANLSNADKEILRKINGDLSLTSLKYGQNILAETNSYELVVDAKKDLSGLPQGLIDAAAVDAKAKGKEGKWVFTLSNSSVMPFLQYSSNRELRKQIWNAYQTRGNQDNEFDNKKNAIALANLRGQKARLLGYKSHSNYVLEESMAKTPENVNKLLNDLWKPALEIAKTEAADIQKMMAKEGIKGAVQPYDWRYYTEKIRKERFDLDEEELKPYFSLENVRKGVFQVTEKLYGLQFKVLTDVPKYHEDVTVWEVTEKDGTHLGVLYMDFHPRESKRGGAWMTSYRTQKTVDGKRVAPVVSIVCNFTKPSANAPALLTFDEVTTFFHEFGHSLHGMLSNVTYKSLAGTSVPRDFVELPSQIMENWAAEPEVLKMYAKHYKTGEVIPETLVNKLKKAGTFDQGFTTTEYLAASLLDLEYHSQTKNITVDANAFEKAAMTKIGLIASIIPRYRSTYFSHIFSGGYSSGYYSYIWSGVLDTDAFEAFKTTTLFNPEKAKLFRENVLEKGGTEDPMVLYKRFRGAEPSIEPLLRKRGLDKKEEVFKKIKG